MSDNKLLNRALFTINQLNGKLKEVLAEKTRWQQENSQEEGQKEDQEIAIIGMSCQFPQAPNIKIFWEQLCNQFDGVTHYPASRLSLLGIDPTDLETKIEDIYGGYLEHVDLFDPSLFKISPREAKCMDPQQRLLLMNTHQAFLDAEILQQTDFKNTGVFISHYASEYMSLGNQYEKENALLLATGNATSISANRISYLYNLVGPSLVLDTACSSSLVGVDIACQYLRKKHIDYAVVGGVSLNLNPHVTQLLQDSSMLAKDGKCKTFDQSADGYVPGEGVGVIVLQRVRDAQLKESKVYSVICASAVNQDGKSNGLTAPNGFAQEQLIKQGFQLANIDPRKVQYIETHGTGTYLGDPVEVEALSNVIKKKHKTAHNDTKKPCVLGCLKTNIGHLEPAAGIASLIKASLCIYQGKIPANNHLKTINPLLNMDETSFVLPNQVLDWPELNKVAGVSSFGFGGVNGHVVLRNMPQELTKERGNIIEKYPLYDFKLKSYWSKKLENTMYPGESRQRKDEGFLSYQLVNSPTDFLRATLVINKRNLPGIEDTGNFHIGFYLEIIYKIFSNHFDTTQIRVERIQFLHALFISKKVNTEIQIILQRNDNNKFHLDFYFKYDNSGSNWIKTAEASVYPATDSGDSLTMTRLPQGKVSDTLTEEQFYNSYEAIGYPAGGFVRAIHSTKVYQKESISKLKLSFGANDYKLGIHPGAIDGALQPGIIMHAGSLSMTTLMEDINIYGPLHAKKTYHLYNKLLNSSTKDNNRFSILWVIYDSDNKIRITCKKAVLQKLSNNNVLKASAEPDLIGISQLTENVLLEEIARLLEMKSNELRTDVLLLELGMDSLMLMSLGRLLDHSNIAINSLFEVTINDLITLIESKEDKVASSEVAPSDAAPIEVSIQPPRELIDYSLDKRKWIRGKKKKKARIQLYCFPHGYASATIFRNWVNTFPAEVDVWPVELPGRGDRCSERPIEFTEEMAEKLTQIIGKDLEQPYALFGHSIGALLAYSWTLHLQKMHMPLPQQLIVGAFTAPMLSNPLLRMIKGQYRFYGIDALPNLEAILDPDNVELVETIIDMTMEMPQGFATAVDRKSTYALLPSMIAALRMADTFDSTKIKPVSVPIVALHGKGDIAVTQDEMQAWEKLTTKPFSIELFSGDHDFINSDQNEKEVIESISNRLMQCIMESA